MLQGLQNILHRSIQLSGGCLGHLEGFAGGLVRSWVASPIGGGRAHGNRIGGKSFCPSVMQRNTFSTSVLGATRDRTRQERRVRAPMDGFTACPEGRLAPAYSNANTAVKAITSIRPDNTPAVAAQAVLPASIRGAHHRNTPAWLTQLKPKCELRPSKNICTEIATSNIPIRRSTAVNTRWPSNL